MIDGWTDKELLEEESHRATVARMKERIAKRKAREYPAWPDEPNRYLALAKAEAEAYNVRVLLWRKSLSGVAHIADSEIEVPQPKTRRALYYFLHEVGHVALGHRGQKPRHLKEYEAEQFAHERMRALGVPVPRQETTRAKSYVARKIRQARRRGAKRINADAARFAKRRSKW